MGREWLILEMEGTMLGGLSMGMLLGKGSISIPMARIMRGSSMSPGSMARALLSTMGARLDIRASSGMGFLRAMGSKPMLMAASTRASLETEKKMALVSIHGPMDSIMKANSSMVLCMGKVFSLIIKELSSRGNFPKD